MDGSGTTLAGLPLIQVAGWAASAVTMIAAVMTASNLGPRITGLGFAVFTFGSVVWATVGGMSGQQSLLVTNLFLTLVNLFGVWRWLGRQARYAEGGKRAALRSRLGAAPSLVALSGLAGSRALGRDGEQLGTVVDAMLYCDGAGIAYVVISDNGLGGVGETLRAVTPDRIEFRQDAIVLNLSSRQFADEPELAQDDWPGQPPAPATPARAILRPATSAAPHDPEE